MHNDIIPVVTTKAEERAAMPLFKRCDGELVCFFCGDVVSKVLAFHSCSPFSLAKRLVDVMNDLADAQQELFEKDLHISQLCAGIANEKDSVRAWKEHAKNCEIEIGMLRDERDKAQDSLRYWIDPVAKPGRVR